jgi:cytidine deaminase
MEAVTTFASIDDLDAESKYLIHKAKEASMHAYAPYSKFFVGASLILDDGTLVIGANQENAAYPLCMCAERVALYTAGVEHPGKKIIKMAVIAHKKNHKELVPVTSCGACRQVMQEFEMRQDSPMEVVMLAANDKWIKMSNATALLPFGFTKDNLHQDGKK